MGAAEGPGSSRGFLVHLPALVGGFSPSWGSGAECQSVCGAAANTFFVIFSSAASCCWFQRIFFPPSKFQIFSLFRLLFWDAACTIRL